MKKNTSFILAASIFLINACSTDYTHSKSNTVDNRGTLSFITDTKEDAAVYLDGQKVGYVDDFIAGDDVLVVLPGAHSLSIIEKNKIIFQQKIFIGNSANKVITLP